MPITNTNMSIDAKVRQWSMSTADKTTATLAQVCCHSRRIKLKKLRIVSTIDCITTDITASVGNGVVIATAPSIGVALAVDVARYLAATAIFGGVTTNKGVVVELDIGGDIVPANVPVTFSVAASAGTGGFAAYIDYEILDDNTLTTE